MRKISDENNKYGLLTKREVKMAGFWPRSFLMTVCFNFSKIHLQNATKRNVLETFNSNMLTKKTALLTTLRALKI